MNCAKKKAACHWEEGFAARLSSTTREQAHIADNENVVHVYSKTHAWHIVSQSDIRPWVLISNIKDDADMQALDDIAPQVSSLVDEWHGQGRIMWSGAFDNQVSSMAVFEATKDEADEFFKKYDKICSGVLEYTMYEWDAMPILSFLS